MMFICEKIKFTIATYIFDVCSGCDGFMLDTHNKLVI